MLMELKQSLEERLDRLEADVADIRETQERLEASVDLSINYGRATAEALGLRDRVRHLEVKHAILQQERRQLAVERDTPPEGMPPVKDE